MSIHSIFKPKSKKDFLQKDINKLLKKAAKSGNFIMVKMLLDSGANIEYKDGYNNTPLYYAAKNSKFDTVKYLVKRGADINSKNYNDNTPLIAALTPYEVTFPNRNSLNMDLIYFLIDKGADFVDGITQFIPNSLIPELIERYNKPISDRDILLIIRNGTLKNVKYLINKGLIDLSDSSILYKLDFYQYLTPSKIVLLKKHGMKINDKLFISFLSNYDNSLYFQRKWKDFINNHINESMIVKLVKENIEYTNEIIGSHHGQEDGEVGLYIDGNVIGYINYTLFKGKLYINYIFVHPDHRRLGYGSKMMKYLKSLYPNFKYNPNMKTEDGSKFIPKETELYERAKLVKENIEKSSGPYRVNAPKIGDIISVYHSKDGGVNMEVVGLPYKNTIPCEYEGIEYTVRLRKILVNDIYEYRWEAEEL